MMSKTLLLGLACLAVLASCTGSYGKTSPDLWLSRDYDRQVVSGGWYAFRPTCYGGSGDYEYSYYNIPSGWRDDDKGDNKYRNYLYYPKGGRNGRYQVQVKVYDIQYSVQLTQYLVIEINGDSLNIFVRETYDYSYRSVGQYVFEKKDIIEFPSWKEVVSLIEDGDVEGLSDIIDRVIESDNDCDDKKDFLNGVLNRITKYINTSSNRLSEQQDVLDSLQAKLEKYQRILKDLLEERKGGNSDISALKKELNDAYSKVRWYQKRIQNAEDDIPSFKASIADLKNKIWELNDKLIPQLKKEISILNKRVTELEWAIKEGKGDVAWYKKELRQVYSELNKKEKQLRNYQDQVDAYNTKIEWFQKKIAALQDQIASDKRDLAIWQAKVRYLEKAIADAKDTSEVDQDIQETKVIIENIKTSITKQRSLIQWTRKTINVLKNAFSRFSITIEKAIYSCYDAPAFNYQEYEGGQYAELDNDGFYGYLGNIYGNNYPKDYFPSRGNKVVVNTVNFYSEEWVRTYGASYSYGSNLFNEEFTCSTLSQTQTYYGKITKITGNSIYVLEEGRQSRLYLSSCSTVQTSNGSKLPKKGDNIVWKGAKRNLGNSYNVRSAICS